MKVYVGSTNKTKVKAVEKVFADYTVEGLAVDSQVSAQPKCDEETIKGAYNRASSLPKGIRIGLEAGVQLTLGVLYLTNFGVLIDEDDNVYYAGGTRIPLPDDVKEKIFTEGLELSVVMMQLTNINGINHKSGAIGYYTDNQVERIDIFIHIAKLLYGQYLHGRKK